MAGVVQKRRACGYILLCAEWIFNYLFTVERTRKNGYHKSEKFLLEKGVTNLASLFLVAFLHLMAWRQIVSMIGIAS